MLVGVMRSLQSKIMISSKSLSPDVLTKASTITERMRLLSFPYFVEHHA